MSFAWNRKSINVATIVDVSAEPAHVGHRDGLKMHA
jgi:hypothetical protein